MTIDQATEPRTPSPITPDAALTRVAAQLLERIRDEQGRLEAHLQDARRLAAVAATLGADAELAEITAQENTLQERLTILEQTRRALLEREHAPATPQAPVATPPPQNPAAAAPEPPRPLPAPVVAAPAVAAPVVAAPPATPPKPVAARQPDAVPSLSQTARPPAVATPAWTPRPLGVLEDELETIAAASEGLWPDAPQSLTLFKMYCSRFRRAFEERKRHTGVQTAWHEQFTALRDIQRERWPDQYCVPLNGAITLPPGDWEILAEHYLALSHVGAAVDWIEDQEPSQPPTWLGRECAPVLESAGAATNLMNRWLMKRLPRYHDPEEVDLYARLRGIGERAGLFIRGLLPEDRIHETELQALAVETEARLRELQGSTGRKKRQADALEALTRLLAEPEFGSGDADDDRLCDAAAACLDSGLPATDKRIRDPLLEYGAMLEDDPRVSRLHTAIVAERTRLDAKAYSEEGPAVERLDALPAEMQALLEAVLPYTEGRKGLIIGGTCREEARQTLATAFQFGDLKWPSIDPSDSFQNSVKEISRADVVFLTRFNRKRSKEAIRLCRDQGKPLIHLPKGYGLHEAIHQAHLQITRRAAP